MIKSIFVSVGVVMLAFFSTIVVAAQERAIDFVEIQNFARMANASYADTTAINKELKAQQYELVKLINVAGYVVTGFVAVNEVTKTQVIVVRGSANEENAIVNAAFQLVPDKISGIKLHQGFSQSSSNFYQQVLPLLRKDYRIITVGHSLGGAVANILAMYLDVDKFNIEKAVTFGQPKVTNVPGARKYAHLNVIRVVTPKDVVPLVPPFDPMDLLKLDIYWHMGKEIVLLDKNEFAVLEGNASMMRAGRFINAVLDESNLQHHMMKEYLSRLAEKTQNSKQVPYATGFSFLGGL